MPPLVNWLARTLGFVWLGFMTFLVYPPKGMAALTVQIIGYAGLGAGLAAWIMIELLSVRGAGERIPGWALPWALGGVAVATGAACGPGNGGAALVIFTAVAAMVAGAELGLAEALAVTCAGILAVDVSGLVFNDSYSTLIGFPAIVLSGLVIGRNRGAYRIQAEQAQILLAQRQQLQAEQRRADLLDERARIAREIHDVLAHSLGALGIQVQAARSLLHKDIDQADELLVAAQRMAAEGLAETRRAVHSLRAGTLPLNEELAQVTSTYAQRYHVAVSFETGGVPAAIPPDATVALLRITQESLVNAAKHAAGQPVEVRLDYGDADVRLTVRNDLPPGPGPGRGSGPGSGRGSGPGSGPGQPPGVSTVDGGYGLTGMHERLRLLNGTLEAGRHGDQWIVTAGLPRPPAPAAPQAENITS
jgi:signal transduction histidine kinase